MPPVGAYVSAFRVISERSTASRYGPSYVHRAVHFAQSCSVCFSALCGSISFGRGECEGCQVSTNATLSPSATVNEEQVLNCWPHVLTGGSLRSQTESGPATATR